MEDKFILVKKAPEFDQANKRAVIRVTPETYETLTNWAALTGKSITEMATKAVAFARPRRRSREREGSKESATPAGRGGDRQSRSG